MPGPTHRWNETGVERIPDDGEDAEPLEHPERRDTEFLKWRKPEPVVPLIEEPTNDPLADAPSPHALVSPPLPTPKAGDIVPDVVHTSRSAAVLPAADPEHPDVIAHTLDRAAALAPAAAVALPTHAMNQRPLPAPDAAAEQPIVHSLDAYMRRELVPVGTATPVIPTHTMQPAPLPAPEGAKPAGVPSFTNGFDALHTAPPAASATAPVHSLDAYARQEEIAAKALAAEWTRKHAAMTAPPAPVLRVPRGLAPLMGRIRQATRAVDPNAPAPGAAPIVVDGEGVDPFPSETHVHDDRAVVVDDEPKPPTQRNT